MKQKIDAVLDRVRDPESGLTVAQLGLIQSFRFIEKGNKLVAFKSQMRSGKGCCTLVANMLLHTTLKELISELEKEFPEYHIEVA